MAASSSILSMGEEYILPSTNSLKPYQYLVDIISLDHNYCRPWSEREKIPHARPAKELFSHQTENESEDAKKTNDKKLTKGDELIDVDTVEEQANHGPAAINMQYDVMKSKIVMAECEKYVGSASSKRTPDTWEELICRTGWTNQQNVLFDKILKIVSAYRLSWLTYEGSVNEPILRRIAVDKATKRVRQILSRIEWDTKLTTWLHSSMVEGLSIPLLACYLDIIQTLRSKVPTLVDKMIAGGTTRRVSAGTTDNLTALLKRPWDATVGLTSFQRPRKITGTPLLLIVPSGPTTSATGNSTKRSRFWHHHLSHFGKVIPVTMHLSNSGRGVSIGQCLDHMIGAVQAKVLELKNHFPNRPVVLIGWTTGALVSFQVSLKESVCAVVCLGFPLQGVEGLRGGAGDPFLDGKTPTMFVFGSLSTSCSLPDIEEFRKKLLSDTSLLVIGGADDQLRLTSAKKKMEGLTQSVVDRRIMDDIGEFLNLAVSSMNDDSHPRLDYFDFDEVETRRKKPKSEYRKRPAGDGTGSATPAKKPRGRTPKAANGEGNGTKKPKPVKNVKKTPVNKPVVLVSGNGQATGASMPAVRPTGSIPIAPLRATHPSISSGILQGVPLTSVSVPISAVGVPLAGVPVSRVSIPGVRIPGVNIPVSGVNVPVSAVIKQGSLGGRSFVFPGPANNVGSPNPGVSSAAITAMGTSGNTHHLKIVMNPSTDGRLKVTGPPTSTLSSDSQSAIQYKTAILTAPVTSKPPAPVADTTANPKSVTSTTFSSSSVVTSLPMTSSVLTSSAATSAAKTPSAAKVASQVITSLTTTSLTSSSVTQQSSTAGSKPVVVSRTVVTVPKSAIISGQAQFIMHQGQLSAVGKQATMRQSSSGNPTVTTQQKPIPQGQRVNTLTGGKPQTTVSSTPSKQTTVRVSHAGSTQAVTNLVRKTPSPQSLTRTIQVGVKRTVTYNPSTPSKTITVVSRSLPSEVLTSQVSNVSAANLARLKERLKSIQTFAGVQTGAQIETLQLKTSQTLANSASTSVQNIQSRNTAQTAARLTEASSAQNTSKVITSSVPQSSAPSIVLSSVQGTAKSSTQTVSTSSAQTMSKSSAQAITLSTPTTTPKSTTKVVQPSKQALSSSSAHSSSTCTGPTEKLTPQPSTKSAAQLIQSAAPATVKLPEHPSAQSISQEAAKTSAQSTAKPTTHFIQVPASTKVSAQNTVKSNAQTLVQSSSQSIQSSTPASTQSSLSSSATSRATDMIVTSVTSQKDKPSVSSQKDEPVVQKAAPNQQTQQPDASSSLGSMSEEKLVEKINNIVNDVFAGNQRTTRQSVRRLVAAAKLAEAQHKRDESGEGNKEQNTKTK